VCDSLIDTLLNINRNTKEGLNNCLNLIEMNTQDELTPIQVGKHTYLHPPVTTCQKMKKKKFFPMSKGCESATKTFIKCEEPSIFARFQANWVEIS